MDVTSSNLLTESLDIVALDKSFDRLHMCGNFDYCVKETVFEHRLRIGGDGCCFINWNCVDV